MTWGSEIEVERRNRIRVSLWAYAYEFKHDSLVPDSVYDATCREINPWTETGHAVLDDFFATQFESSTGLWIHHHPELTKIGALYLRVQNGMS